MRSLLSGGAATWFVYNALTFIPRGAYLNSGASGGIDGDPGAVAVTWAARQLFIGLALVALALVEWGEVASFFSMPTHGQVSRPPEHNV